MTDYELRVTTSGSLWQPAQEIVSVVAQALTGIPRVQHNYTEAENYDTYGLVRVGFTYGQEVEVEAIPAIISLILIALSILGIVYLAYELVEVAPKSVGGMVVIAAIGLISAGYFISKFRGKNDT